MSDMTPILLLGAGRMGGALIAGWSKAQAFAEIDLIAVEPHPSEALKASGVLLNPPETYLSRARTAVLAVKPQVWRGAAAQYGPLLAKDAVIVSIAAGVSAADISAAFGGRRVARVMPTTAVSICRGAALDLRSRCPGQGPRPRPVRARGHDGRPRRREADARRHRRLRLGAGLSLRLRGGPGGGRPFGGPDGSGRQGPGAGHHHRPRPCCWRKAARSPPNCASRSPRPAAPRRRR